METRRPSLFIQGTGSYVPERLVTNEDLAQIVDTSDEWIRTRSGITERRIAAPGEATSDLAVQAALRAITDAGLTKEDIDLLIVATVTPDQPFPATACLVQTKLGLQPIAAFDISAACTGFLYILETAAALLERGPYRHALIIGAEKFSAIVDWQDRTTCVLFGDGAGAAIISRENKSGFEIIDTLIGADGANADILCIPAGGTACPSSPQTLEAHLQYVKMNGREVFKQAVRVMGQVAQTLLARHGLTPADIKVIIPHQANVRIIEALAKGFDLPLDRFFINLHHYGNTSAASIPLALDEARKAYDWQKGDYVLLVAFGAGLTWGSTLLKYI